VAAPVRKGEEVELRVDSLAYGGNGVARLDGFVVFVRGGLPGDVVRARATKVKRGFAEATRTALLEPGPDRVDAPCRHFGICGGCRFQDLAYERQVAAKADQVRDALVRLGGYPEPPLEPIVPARSIYGYRNKLEYSFAAGEDGALALGFHRAGRWDEVVHVDECLLTTDLGNAVRTAVLEWARSEGLEPYDQETQTGYLRHLVLREARNTGQISAAQFVELNERIGGFDADDERCDGSDDEEDRVRCHRVEDGVGGRVFERLGVGFGDPQPLARGHPGPGVEAREFGTARRRFQIFDDGHVRAGILQQGERFTRLGTAWIVINGGLQE